MKEIKNFSSLKHSQRLCLTGALCLFFFTISSFSFSQSLDTLCICKDSTLALKIDSIYDNTFVGLYNLIDKKTNFVTKGTLLIEQGLYAKKSNKKGYSSSSTVKSFNVLFLSENKIISILYISGNRFTEDYYKIIRSLKKGDIIIFDNICLNTCEYIERVSPVIYKIE